MQDGTLTKHEHPDVSKAHASNRQKFEVGCDCEVVSDLLSRVGDKWSILVVAILGNDTLRFSELRRKVGSISQKMLTTTLRNLERDGFVSRKVYPTIPPKVEYQLTDLGKNLLVPVDELARWAKSNAELVTKAREKFDQDKV